MMNSKSSRLHDYHRKAARVWKGDELQGVLGLRLEQVSDRHLGSGGFHLTRSRREPKELLQWIVTWADQSAPFSPYTDGIEDDNGDFIDLLNNNILLLGGVAYRLEWLSGNDLQDALQCTVDGAT